MLAGVYATGTQLVFKSRIATIVRARDVTCSMYTPCVELGNKTYNQVTAKETGRGLNGLGALQPIQASSICRGSGMCTIMASGGTGKWGGRKVRNFPAGDLVCRAYFDD